MPSWREESTGVEVWHESCAGQHAAEQYNPFEIFYFISNEFNDTEGE